MAGIYVFARLSRRNAARRGGGPEFISRELHREEGDLQECSASLDSRSMEGDDTGTSTGIDIDGSTGVDIANLGGIFAPRREVSGAELSVDVSILAGLRATYESTLDGSVDGFAPPVPYKRKVGGSTPHASDEITGGGAAPPASDEITEGGAVPPADPGAATPLAIDMSRPLVYLTLVAKHERLSGREILDALDAEGFRPGLMQLYYQRSEADPSIVVGVANMAEAGVLEPDSLPDMETPGLVTFTSVSDDETHALKTFDRMVAASRRLASRLDVTLSDETRSTLTAQAENHLRERVADIVRRGRMQD